MEQVAYPLCYIKKQTAMNTSQREHLKKYILDRVDRSGPCWNWKKSTRNGYGQAYLGTTAYAHRVSYLAFNGDIPDGMQVCHACDNRKCCNPKHLWLGTNADNVADMVSKGRNSPPPLITRRGEDNPLSKLTKVQVAEIRAMYAGGGVSQLEIGHRYGVHQMTISRIVRRKRWAKE